MDWKSLSPKQKLTLFELKMEARKKIEELRKSSMNSTPTEDDQQLKQKNIHQYLSLLKTREKLLALRERLQNKIKGE